MANGLPDLLSMYRESLASERQSQMGEMQLALSMMQYEAEQAFREEGRRREFAYQDLATAQANVQQAIDRDRDMIYFKFRGLDWIKRDSDDGSVEKLDAKKAGKAGFTDQQATDIYNMVSMYENPALSEIAGVAAINIGRNISQDYDKWSSGGFADKHKSNYITALEDSGILYAGIVNKEGQRVYDEVEMRTSYEPFHAMPEGLQLLDNVSQELAEIAKGDYKIDREIGFGPMETGYSVDLDQVVSGYADAFERLPEDQVLPIDDLGYEEQRTELEKLNDDIREMSSQKKLQTDIMGKDFSGLDKLSQDIQRMQDRKEEIQSGIKQSLEQHQLEQGRIELDDAVERMLIDAGLPKTKENKEAAKIRAFEIMEQEALANIRTTAPFEVAAAEQPRAFTGLYDQPLLPDPYE